MMGTEKSYLEIRILSLLVIVLLSGCQTSSNSAWKNTAIQAARFHQIETSYEQYSLNYEAGKVGFRIDIRKDISPEQKIKILEEGKVTNPSHIEKLFSFTLNGVPLKIQDAEFPESGRLGLGALIESPVPSWIFQFHPGLVHLYTQAQMEDPSDILAFAKALYSLQNPLHPDLTPLAVQWYIRAADAGSADAAYETVYFYESGIGVTENPLKAEAYLLAAAQLGRAAAMNDLAWKVATMRSATETRLQEAKDLITKAISMEPLPYRLDTLALIEARLGNWDRAVELESEAISALENAYSENGKIMIPQEEMEIYEFLQFMREAFLNQEIPQVLFL